MMTAEDSMPVIPDIFYWRFCFVFLYNLLFMAIFLFIIKRKSGY